MQKALRNYVGSVAADRDGNSHQDANVNLTEPFNLGDAYLVGTELKLTLALAIIIAVLLFKPSGLFGRVVVSRV